MSFWPQSKSIYALDPTQHFPENNPTHYVLHQHYHHYMIKILFETESQFITYRDIYCQLCREADQIAVFTSTLDSQFNINDTWKKWIQKCKII